MLGGWRVSERRKSVLLCLKSSNGVQGACLLLVENALINPEMGEVGVAGGLCVEAANLTLSIDPFELLLEEADL
jgi:hypothetical protein